MRRHHRLRLHEPSQPVAARSARRTTVARTLAAGQRTPGRRFSTRSTRLANWSWREASPVTRRTSPRVFAGGAGRPGQPRPDPGRYPPARCSSCSRAFRSTVPTPGPAVARCRIARCSAMPQRRPARISTKPTGRSSTISNAGSAGSAARAAARSAAAPARRVAGALPAVEFADRSQGRGGYRLLSLGGPALAQRRRLRPAALRRFRRGIPCRLRSQAPGQPARPAGHRQP